MPRWSTATSRLAAPVPGAPRVIATAQPSPPAVGENLVEGETHDFAGFRDGESSSRCPSSRSSSPPSRPASCAAALALRYPHAVAGASVEPVAEGVVRAASRHAALRRWLRARRDPEPLTGLALTLAALVVLAGGLIVAVLAYLVRGNDTLRRIDSAAADWGHDHASDASDAIVTAVTQLGETWFVIVAGLLIAARRVAARLQPPRRALPRPGRRGGQAAHHGDQGPRRPGPAHAQPDRGDPRALLPERPLLDRGRVLRGRGAGPRPWPPPPAARRHRGRRGRPGGGRRREPGPPRRALALGRPGRPGARLGVVRPLRRRRGRPPAALRRDGRAHRVGGARRRPPGRLRPDGGVEPAADREHRLATMAASTHQAVHEVTTEPPRSSASPGPATSPAASSTR